MPGNLFDYLPIELAELILMKLPITDHALRTSSVSKRWLHAWTSIPKLVFSDRYWPIGMKIGFVEFVDGVLSSHNGPILDFRLTTDVNCHKTLNRWLDVVLTDRITELHLALCLTYHDFNVSSRLFSCHQLVHLKLKSCTLTLPENFKGFHKLRSLHLNQVHISSDELKCLLSCCTDQLQELTLINLPAECAQIDLSNTQVQKLHIRGEYEILNLANQHLINASIHLDHLMSSWRCHELGSILYPHYNISHLELSGDLKVNPTYLRYMVKLEEVIFNYLMDPFESISEIVSNCPRLKKLVVKGLSDIRHDLRITSETLESLEIDCGYSHLSIECPQLIDASIYISPVFHRWNFLRQCPDLSPYLELDLKILEEWQKEVQLPMALKHLKYLSLDVRFGNVFNEYIAFCFMKVASALTVLEIKNYEPPITLSFNLWDDCIKKSGLIVRFKRLLVLKMTGFEGTEEELSFMDFIINSAPVLERVEIKLAILADPDILEELQFTSFSKLAKIANIIFV